MLREIIYDILKRILNQRQEIEEERAEVRCKDCNKPGYYTKKVVSVNNFNQHWRMLVQSTKKVLNMKRTSQKGKKKQKCKVMITDKKKVSLVAQVITKKAIRVQNQRASQITN